GVQCICTVARDAGFEPLYLQQFRKTVRRGSVVVDDENPQRGSGAAAGAWIRQGRASLVSKLALELEDLQQRFAPIDAVALLQQSGQVSGIAIQERHVFAGQ